MIFLVEDSRIISFSEFLDKEKSHKLYVRLVLSEDSKSVDEFAVCLIKIEFDLYCEIVRYDCARDERLHIHRFYKKPPEKAVLSALPEWEAVEKCISDIKNNWQEYSKKHFKSRHFSK